MQSMALPPLGFLGAGKMATALARGWVAAGLVAPEQIRASDPLLQAREAFGREVGARVLADNRQLIQASEVLVLAVRPQSLAAALAAFRGSLPSHHLFVSVVPGATLAQLAQELGRAVRVIRVMPNPPSLVGASAAAYAAGPTATAEDQQLVQRLLEAVGIAYCL